MKWELLEATFVFEIKTTDLDAMVNLYYAG